MKPLPIGSRFMPGQEDNGCSPEEYLAHITPLVEAVAAIPAEIADEADAELAARIAAEKADKEAPQ